MGNEFQKVDIRLFWQPAISCRFRLLRQLRKWRRALEELFRKEVPKTRSHEEHVTISLHYVCLRYQEHSKEINPGPDPKHGNKIHIHVVFGPTTVPRCRSRNKMQEASDLGIQLSSHRRRWLGEEAKRSVPFRIRRRRRHWAALERKAFQDDVSENVTVLSVSLLYAPPLSLSLHEISLLFWTMCLSRSSPIPSASSIVVPPNLPLKPYTLITDPGHTACLSVSFRSGWFRRFRFASLARQASSMTAADWLASVSVPLSSDRLAVQSSERCS